MKMIFTNSILTMKPESKHRRKEQLLGLRRLLVRLSKNRKMKETQTKRMNGKLMCQSRVRSRRDRRNHS